MTRHFRKFLAVAFFVSAFFIVGLLPVLAHASEEPGMAIEDLPPAPSGIALEQGVNFYRAKVLAILSEGKKPIDGVPMDYQEVRLEILNGDEQGKTVVVDHGGPFAIEEYQRVRVGETVILAKPTSSLKPDFYYITDKYRTPRMVWVIVFFVALAVFFGRKRGVTSLLGMLFSVAIIFLFIIPRILAGGDPFLISLVGSLVILVISLYLSHGFNRRTSIALLSTLAALGLAAILDLAFVFLTRLHGIGTEEAFYLQFGSVNLNLRGLLLVGIIIGMLGVLDDVTTTQVATVEEIHTANTALSFQKLFQKGLSVGREHIASLVNTLVLAYVGASFPLLLLATTQKAQPAWLIFNSNFIGEEIVRTLVGSSALILAVPISPIFAAYFYGQRGRGY